LVRSGAVALLAPLLAAPAAGQPPLGEIRAALATHAVDRPPPETLSELDPASLTEQLRRIDPYARFFTAADRALERAAGDDAVGIGAALGRWNDRYVLTPYSDGALAGAGLRGPVRLTRVDGVEVAALPLAEVASRLRGEPGTPVRLGLGSAAPAQDLELVRQPFRRVPVEPVRVAGHRVVRVRDFATGATRTHVAVALGPLAAGETAILDLRDSPGGDLFEALDSAALFVPQGTLLARTRSAAGQVRSYLSPPGAKLRPPSVVLWIGPGTASAAEIFAGILSRHGLARLVGGRTFGKCRTQTDLTLSDGSVLRLTNRVVLLPDGQDCTGVGLAPDVEVDPEGLLDDERLLGQSLARP
jgi:carboxyl-terminal processing protease